MEHCRDNPAFEKLVHELNDPTTLRAYKDSGDNYSPSIIPRLLGSFLVLCGNTVYGKKPSYLKFRAVEVIARVPYHSWESAAYTLLTLCYTRERKALLLSNTTKFARLAQDNETMHVVVISALAKQEEPAGFIRHTLIPIVFAFFYFWASYILYLLKPRYSLELNYLFEQHAFDQYSWFLQLYEHKLKHASLSSEYLTWYGRHPRSQYEFFSLVRNDELVHRNSSLHEIRALKRK